MRWRYRRDDPFVGDGWWFCACPTHVQRTLDVLAITANTGLLTVAYLLKKQVREFVLCPKSVAMAHQVIDNQALRESNTRLVLGLVAIPR